MEIEIFPAAQERLIEIWFYTARKWEVKQADAYSSKLNDSINLIAKNRHLWRALEGMENIFSIRHEHHYIFFRELSNSIGVISVLHENMDIPARLKEDNKSAPKHP